MSFARNVNFNQMLADKGRRQDEGLALERLKINDAYQIGMINALKQSGVSEKPAATTTAAPVKTPTFSNLIAKGGSTLPTSMAPAAPGPLPINEGMPGSGTMGRTMFSTDAAGGVTVPDRAGYQTVLDETPGLKEGGIIERIKEGLGLVRPAKTGEVVGDQAKDANRVANQTGGMVGVAAKALQSRQMRIEEELKRQGLRAGTEYVTDPTGNGSPTEDTVDAKLAEGEAVLNAGAAKIVGREGIAALNERGLKEMGMEGAQTEVKKGVIHAAAGFLPEEDRINRMKLRFGMIDNNAQAIDQSAGNRYDDNKVFQALGMDPVGAGGGAALKAISEVPSTIKRVVQQPIMSIENTAQTAQEPAASRAVAAPAANIANPSISSKAMSASMMQPEKSTGESMTPGDAMRLRRPAEPQYSQQVPVPSGYVAPKAPVIAARGVTKEDRSNYDLAEQGFGGVVRKAGNVYTDAGANPYLNQQFKEHDGMTGQQLLDQRIATDATRQAEAVAKEDKAKLDALEAADPRVRIARIEKEGTAAMKKAEQDAAVNLAREQNPKLTRAQEMAIRYGVKDATAKNDGYKVDMNEVARALGTVAMDDISGKQVLNRNQDEERKFFSWMEKSGIKDTNQGLALYLADKAPKPFASSAEVEAAAKAGQIKPGDKVIVNGRQATWQ